GAWRETDPYRPAEAQSRPPRLVMGDRVVWILAVLDGRRDIQDVLARRLLRCRRKGRPAGPSARPRSRAASRRRAARAVLPVRAPAGAGAAAAPLGTPARRGLARRRHRPRAGQGQRGRRGSTRPGRGEDSGVMLRARWTTSRSSTMWRTG